MKDGFDMTALVFFVCWGIGVQAPESAHTLDALMTLWPFPRRTTASVSQRDERMDSFLSLSTGCTITPGIGGITAR